MNIKLILAGAGTAIAGLGVGIGIPIMANAGFAVTSYEQAQAILNGQPIPDKAKKPVENQSEEKEKGTGKEADNSAASSENETNSETVEVTETTDSAENATDENATTVNKESTVDRDITIDDKTVVLDWDYFDWAVKGIKMTDADLDSISDAFGLNRNSVEYTDSGFKINYEGQDWNGKKANVYYSYRDASDIYVNVYYDGEKYVTEMLDDVPADVHVTGNISINGSMSDPNNWDGYWSLYYSFNENRGNDQVDNLYLSHTGGITKEDQEELMKCVSVPLIYGTREDIESVFHIAEMKEKGMKNETASQNNSEEYIVKTNLGKCVLSINRFQGDSKNPESTATGYWLRFEGGKYECYATIWDNEELMRDIHYSIKH